MENHTRLLLPQNDEKIYRRRSMIRKGCTGMALGTVFGIIIPFIFYGTLHLLGFGSYGIIKGSIAAEIEHNLGNITKGSLFACKL